MKLFIKNMMSLRCKIVVKEALEKIGIHFIAVEMGEVEIAEKVSDWEYHMMKQALSHYGLEIMVDPKIMLIEKIKNVIVELIHYSDERIPINYSDHLSKKLHYNYTYLANIFSASEGITIEKFIICHKIERVKHFLINNQLSLTQIAQKMHYSSVAHVSTQFKKTTGVTPSVYKLQTRRQRATPDTACTA